MVGTICLPTKTGAGVFGGVVIRTGGITVACCPYPPDINWRRRSGRTGVLDAKEVTNRVLLGQTPNRAWYGLASSLH